MLDRLFKKDFTNEKFLQELLLPSPNIKWLENALTHQSIDINFVDENNNTFLMITLQKSAYTSAIWLIDNGINTTIANNQNKLPIDLAVEKDKIKIVEELLKFDKLDIDRKDEYGRSLLQNIIVTGNHNMAKILIRSGANINTLDHKGKHILYDALSYGDPVFVRHLLTHKDIELNDIDKDGNTLMQHPQIEQNDTLAKDLLIAGADPTILNAKGESFLYKIALRGVEASDIMDIALAHGANVNARTKTQNTIMMELLLRASEVPSSNQKYRLELMDIVEKMINHHGDINALDYKSESGLFNAVKIKDASLIAFLLKSRIDPNIQNLQGKTVLEDLVYTGMEHSKIIKILLKYGLDPTLKNKNGQTIYEILTNLILHKDGSVLLKDKKLLSLYVEDALYLNVVQLLLDFEEIPDGKEFILDFLDSTGDPLFFKPLIYDNFALFSLYTRYPINLHKLNNQHHNIFFAYVSRVFENNNAESAVCQNFKNNVSSLISRKLDKNFKDVLGWTILHKIVSSKCNIKLFKILTEVVRFDYNVTDKLGRSVVHNSVWQDNEEIIKIVNKISPSIINNEDIYAITPIYYASLLGNQELVILFFNLGANVTLSRKMDAKAIKKFKPMLKNLPKLLEDIVDPALKTRIESLSKEIVSQFR